LANGPFFLVCDNKQVAFQPDIPPSVVFLQVKEPAEELTGGSGRREVDTEKVLRSDLVESDFPDFDFSSVNFTQNGGGLQLDAADVFSMKFDCSHGKAPTRRQQAPERQRNGEKPVTR